MVSRAFSALCVYSKFEHHPHPLGYLCANFRFFRGLHCWASLWRKNRVLNYSPSLFDAPVTEASALEQRMLDKVVQVMHWVLFAVTTSQVEPVEGDEVAAADEYQEDIGDEQQEVDDTVRLNHM